VEVFVSFICTSVEELADIVKTATAPFEIIGTATKRSLGRPIRERDVLDLSKFSAVHAYEPEELILDIGTGAKLADVEKTLTKQNQYLAFEPPDYSKLLGSKHSGTVGGMMACNLSGPRRIKAGAARDHILGLSAVSGRGEIFKAGARVVKNVTGYDVPKLIAGSYGTLAAMTSVIIKVLPKPEIEETVFIKGLNDEAAVQAMSIAMQSSVEVSGAAHIPNQGTYLRIEGIAPSVTYRRDKLKALLKTEIEILDGADSRQQWKSIRDVIPLADNLSRCVWKISVAPSLAPSVIAKLNFEFRYFFDWAGGLIWLDCDGDHALEVRAAIGNGHATLIRAPDSIRTQAVIFHSQPPALAALSARVKNSFDPKGLFNPGRMYEGV
jgi:glycolate oxidase FAD binding subunit